MDTRNSVQQTIDDFAKSRGYTKRSGSWYRRSSETLSVLNLQKSQYGRSYYLNIGVWLLPVEDASYPKEQQCHIRTRLSSLVPPGEEGKLSDLLDLDSKITDESRVSGLNEALELWLLPAIDATTSLEALRTPAGRQILSASLVRASAMEILRSGP